MAWCRHYCVVMGAHERVPSCSLVLLMTKGVKCIFTSGRPFGRFPPPPVAAKSQDAKNKDMVKKYALGSYSRAMGSNLLVFGHLAGKNLSAWCLFRFQVFSLSKSII